MVSEPDPIRRAEAAQPAPLAPPAPPAPIEAEPNWPRRAWEALVDEWRGFFAVAVAITITPRRFAREWADGQRPALNPLACALNAFAIDFVSRWAWQHELGYALPSPGVDLTEPWLRAALLVVVGSFYHFPLRWMGSRRRWRTTVATLLYTAAGPWLLTQLVLEPLMIGALKQRSLGLSLSVATMIVPQLVYYVLPQMGAHKLPWWRALLAFLIFVALLLVVFGLLLGVVAIPLLKQRGLLPLVPDMR